MYSHHLWIQSQLTLNCIVKCIVKFTHGLSIGTTVHAEYRFGKFYVQHLFRDFLFGINVELNFWNSDGVSFIKRWLKRTHF